MKKLSAYGRKGYLSYLLSDLPMIIRTRRIYGFNSILERVWFDLGHEARISIPGPGKGFINGKNA